jgi:hypothetical protein
MFSNGRVSGSNVRKEINRVTIHQTFYFFTFSQVPSLSPPTTAMIPPLNKTLYC